MAELESRISDCQLLAYRRGEHHPGPRLAALPETLQRLILHMIQLQPGARLAQMASIIRTVCSMFLQPPCAASLCARPLSLDTCSRLQHHRILAGIVQNHDC